MDFSVCVPVRLCVCGGCGGCGGCSGCVKERQSAGQAGRASRFSDASLRGFASRDNTLTFALLSYLGKQFVPISTHHELHPTDQSSLRLQLID